MELQATFIGLGNMGSPMATNLLKHKIHLHVFNRHVDKTQALVQAGAQLIKSPKEAFNQKNKVVLTMLANDQALEEVTQELLENISPGCLHISLSTVSPSTNRKLAELHHEKKAFFVSAPVFGRPDAAAAQKLFVCLSGTKQAKEMARPYLEAIGQKIYDFGEDPGAANVVKLIGNFLILSAVEGLGEGMALAAKCGIDPTLVSSCLTDSLFSSPPYKAYGKIISEQAFEPAGFKMELGLKDIDLLLQTADEHKVPLPLGSLLHNRLIAGIANGRKDFDWSAITLNSWEEAGLKTS